MEDFHYVPDLRVVRSARNFLHSICEVYGSDNGMRVWDNIRECLGDQIASDIFLGMLIGSDEIHVESIGQRFIEAIKEVRALTGMGLKEAKDFCDSVRDGGVQTLRVENVSQERIDAFIRNMKAMGCVVK